MITKAIQFLLIGLVAIGAFASMAKNAYGFTFMGVSCFGLALLYLVKLGWRLTENNFRPEKHEIVTLTELFLLAVLLILFGCRIFYVYIPGGEYIFIAVCLLLMLVYLFIATQSFNTTVKDNKALAWNMASFYSSLSFFILAMIMRVYILWSLFLGVIAVLASLPFIFSVIRQRQIGLSGKTLSLFQLVVTSKNKAGLLFLFFISSALYTGLSQVGVIPEIENLDRPKVYLKLIEGAESGTEKPVGGKYKHEQYKQAMDAFLERHRQ
jgi:hypothetical protein